MACTQKQAKQLFLSKSTYSQELRANVCIVRVGVSDRGKGFVFGFLPL